MATHTTEKTTTGASTATDPHPSGKGGTKEADDVRAGSKTMVKILKWLVAVVIIRIILGGEISGGGSASWFTNHRMRLTMYSANDELMLNDATHDHEWVTDYNEARDLVSWSHPNGDWTVAYTGKWAGTTQVAGKMLSGWLGSWTGYKNGMIADSGGFFLNRDPGRTRTAYRWRGGGEVTRKLVLAPE